MMGLVHIVAASAALVLGAIVLWLPKGTVQHRWSGRSYLVAMLVLNGAALTVYEDSTDGFGVFHYLAFASLVTLACAYLAVALRRPRAAWRPLHGYFMAWSYVGLVGAASGQLAVALKLPVAWMIAIVLLLGGAAVHTQLPRSFGHSHRPSNYKG